MTLLLTLKTKMVKTLKKAKEDFLECNNESNELRLVPKIDITFKALSFFRSLEGL